MQITVKPHTSQVYGRAFTLKSSDIERLTDLRLATLQTYRAMVDCEQREKFHARRKDKVKRNGAAYRQHAAAEKKLAREWPILLERNERAWAKLRTFMDVVRLQNGRLYADELTTVAYDRALDLI